MSDQPLTQHLLIGIGTLQRPKMLTDCLNSLSKIKVPQGYQISLLLVDNDCNHSALPIFQSIAAELPFASYIIMEPKRGIVHMRNRVLDHAKENNVDLIAFIDDDEVVETEWLIVMLNALKKYDADAVHGRVERILPSDTAPYLLKGKFFESANRTTGIIRQAASTSNVLFKSWIIDELGLRFHPALNFSGASDTYLFSQATDKGAKIVWCNEKTVTEYFPRSRANPKWLLRRAFRRTNSKFIRNRLKHGVVISSIKFFILALIQFVTGLFLLVITGPFSKIWRLKSKQLIWKSFGCWNGLLGRTYREYEQIHGS